MCLNGGGGMEPAAVALPSWDLEYTTVGGVGDGRDRPGLH